MTAEEHLRTMLGDLMLTIAKLSAERDTLRDRLPPEPPAPVPTPGATP